MNKLLRILFPIWYLFFEIDNIGRNEFDKNKLD